MRLCFKLEGIDSGWSVGTHLRSSFISLQNSCCPPKSPPFFPSVAQIFPSFPCCQTTCFYHTVERRREVKDVGFQGLGVLRSRHSSSPFPTLSQPALFSTHHGLTPSCLITGKYTKTKVLEGIYTMSSYGKFVQVFERHDMMM